MRDHIHPTLDVPSSFSAGCLPIRPSPPPRPARAYRIGIDRDLAGSTSRFFVCILPEIVPRGKPASPDPDTQSLALGSLNQDFGAAGPPVLAIANAMGSGKLASILYGGMRGAEAGLGRETWHCYRPEYDPVCAI